MRRSYLRVSSLTVTAMCAKLCCCLNLSDCPTMRCVLISNHLSLSCGTVLLTRKSWSLHSNVMPIPRLQGKKHAQKLKVYLQARKEEKMNKVPQVSANLMILLHYKIKIELHRGMKRNHNATHLPSNGKECTGSLVSLSRYSMRDKEGSS